MKKPAIAAQCWYSADQYAEIKAMMEDGHLLPERYAHWREGAEQREEQARRHGATVVRVPFDPAEFRRFCLHFGVPINSDSRMKFAALKAAQDARDTH